MTPTKQTEAYYPLALGQTWRYALSGRPETAGARVETVRNRWEVPANDGSGLVVIAEITREEPGMRPIRYSIEYLPNGMIRSYDPTLPVPGVPIAKAPAAQDQTWGMNPGGGHTGYFGGLQEAGLATDTVGGITYKDCLKVGMLTRGDGYRPFNRETLWAPGIGPIKITEQGPGRTSRVLELVVSPR